MNTPNEFQTRIAQAACVDRGVTFVSYTPDGSQVTERVTWAKLHADGCAYGNDLSERFGFGPGSKVGMLGGTSRAMVTAVEAAWIAGACVSMLPVPFRLKSIDALIEATRGKIATVGMDVLLVDDLAAVVFDGLNLGVETIRLSELPAASTRAVDPPGWAAWGGVGPEALAILQFTSGSTAEPKAVEVTYDVLGVNLGCVVDHLGITANPGVDVAVSWLPLFHDMGLVGILGGSMISGTELVLASPQDFIAAPDRWMRLIAQFGGTLTAGPNFAYAMAAKALRNPWEHLDLSSLRLALNGAEPVIGDAVRSFTDAAALHGMDPGAVFPVYGMAEVGIAASFPPPGRGLTVEHIDTDVFETKGVATPVPTSHADGSGREMVLLGRPLECLDFKVVDPESFTALPARHVGEIWLSGRSVTPGYYDNMAANAAAFHDGWLRTGDLGYVTEDGEYVICGRIKDLIIAGGRNLYPQDIEGAVAQVEGVRVGNVIAFGVHDGRTEQVVVVAESKLGDSGVLRRKVKQAVAFACGVTPHVVMIVEPGTLPKTSSGKLQRAVCKTDYLAGDLVRFVPELVG